MDSQEKTPFDVHVFVCTNQRDGKASCAASGGTLVKDELKKLLREQMPERRHRVNAAGCLGLCEKGVVCMVYPTGHMHTLCTPEDVADLAQRIVRQVGAET